MEDGGARYGRVDGRGRAGWKMEGRVRGRWRGAIREGTGLWRGTIQEGGRVWTGLPPGNLLRQFQTLLFDASKSRSLSPI